MSNRKLRAGIIGLGVGQAHAKGYINSPHSELVAICDLNETRLHEWGEKWNVEAQYTNYMTMLHEAKLDIVSVCLPNAAHAEVSISALKGGVHVLCEKPMAINVAEAEAMVASAKTSQRHLMVSYNYRYRSDSQWMRHMVKDGNLGNIYHAHVIWLRETGIPGWGLFGSKAASGGGALIDLGVHVIDLALWMMDFPAVKTVSGQTRSLFGLLGRKTWGRTEGEAIEGGFDVDDGSVAFLRLANRVCMTLNIAWAEHGQPQEDMFRVELQGTEGSAILHVRNYKNEDTLRFYTEMAGEPVTVIPGVRFGGAQGHEAMIKHLIESIQNGEEPTTNGEQGLIGVQILEALYQSADTGREVVLGDG